MSDNLHSIGIDVCKRFLDIHVYPTGKCWRVPNTIVGLLSVRSQFPEPDDVKRVILESTGGYEREAALWLSQAGYAVAVMNAVKDTTLPKLPINRQKRIKLMLKF